MAEKLQSVRGTHDLLPDEYEKFHAVVTRARELAVLYGFREMATPIFEMTEVFKRSMGETSDVVSKEMFAFDTKGGESVCLRPEFTAGVARAFISNGMQQHLPLKLFSTGPLFRYERPQRGRQRQFHQVNFEWLGDDSPDVDIEMILLAGHLLYFLSGRPITLQINTLGDKESRARYRDTLVGYLTPYKNALSEDSQRRLEKNPLRILDSKDPRDKEITAAAPKVTDYLNDSASARFRYICETLEAQKVPYFKAINIDPSLVRGLDYYTDTVFECIGDTGDLGAQNTLLAGGRYDGLIEQMGGKPTPAIGFAAGIERLLLSTHDLSLRKLADIKIFILPFEEMSPSHVHALAGVCRLMLFELLSERRIKRQCSVEIFWQGKLGKRMEKASKHAATHVVILGEDEVKDKKCVLKNMLTGEQKVVAFDDLTHKNTLAGLLEI